MQTALELVSWVYLVEDKTSKTVSANKFNEEFSAEERIVALLQKLSIPTVVPSSLSALASAATALGATDGVGVLVSLRNAIVHPKKSKRRKLAQAGVAARDEVLAIGLWYLELALLRLFGYSGVYYSRLKSGYRGELRDTVPWE